MVEFSLSTPIPGDFLRLSGNPNHLSTGIVESTMFMPDGNCYIRYYSRAEIPHNKTFGSHLVEETETIVTTPDPEVYNYLYIEGQVRVSIEASLIRSYLREHWERPNFKVDGMDWRVYKLPIPQRLSHGRRLLVYSRNGLALKGFYKSLQKNDYGDLAWKGRKIMEDDLEYEIWDADDQSLKIGAMNDSGMMFYSIVDCI
jgi:hypothetical protein